MLLGRQLKSQASMLAPYRQKWASGIVESVVWPDKFSDRKPN
jgi:hypothetical protein